MTEKKTTKANVSKKTDFEKKLDDVKKTATETAGKVGEESKKIVSGIGAWRERSSTEEKLYKIFGIIFLFIGLILLRDLIGGLLLIILGILFVTGFFMSDKKEKK